MMIQISKIRLLIIIFFTVSLSGFSLFVYSVQTSTFTRTHVYGIVVDSKTGQLLPGALIVFAHIDDKTMQWRVVAKSETDASGSYEKWINPGSYDVYVSCNLSSTPGFDYVPVHIQISLKDVTFNASFALVPGASVNSLGDLSLFGSDPEQIIFTIIDHSGLLERTNSVLKYTSLVRYILRLDGRTIIVPSDTPLNINIDITYPMMELQLTVDKEAEHLNLTQGSKLTFNLRDFLMQSSVDLTQSLLQSIQATVDEAEKAGFYLSYEKVKLVRAENMIEAIHSALVKKEYDKAYTDSFETYLILQDLEKSILSMYANSSQSIIFITPFLGFTAVIVAAIFTEDRLQGLAISLTIYSLLVGFLYIIYPGYTFVLKSDFNQTFGISSGILFPILLVTSFLGVFLVVHYLPYAFKEKTSMDGLRLISALAVASSIATRNLRRRRLRSLLTALLIFISVFAFMSLTSISFEHGFYIKTFPTQSTSEGIHLRKPSTAQNIPFNPISSTGLQQIDAWLLQRPESTMVAPMIESKPPFGGSVPPHLITTIYANDSELSFNILGILGVSPSFEVEATNMDTIMVQGRFLSDEDVRGILLSREAAEMLQVKLNDEVILYDQAFKVTGIFDGSKFDALRDLNGLPLSPEYVFAPPQVGFVFMYVPGWNVVIVHGETAQVLPEMVISRVNIQTQDPQEIMTLARMMVLRWSGFDAFASVAGEVFHLQIGEHYIASGFTTALFPLILVVLNVGAFMLGAVYERRREVATMSAVGMNPFHISAVFVTEAVVVSVAAGSLGYILGLTSYRFMPMFIHGLILKQKVEVSWGIIVLILSISAAVMGSALPATKASVIVTPSLLKKWKIESRPNTSTEPFLLSLPIRINEKELETFLVLMEKWLQESPFIEKVKVSSKGSATCISFTFVLTEYQSVVTDNILYLEKTHLPNQYIACLSCKTRQEMTMSRYEASVHRTTTFIRSLILQYSIAS